MTTKLQTGIGLVLAVSVGGVGTAGCNRDVRLAGENVRTVTVHPVTHYGVTLDEHASPEQTVYVLLRAIRDDFLASNQTRREAALDKQFDVCAANVIAASNPIGISRDEYVYRAVNQWTPTVSHYVHGFETEWEKARGRFVKVGPKSGGDAESGARECQVLMQLDDPSGDPKARVVLVVGLAQDKGLWRTARLGFTPRARTLRSRTAATSPGKSTHPPGD